MALIDEPDFTAGRVDPEIAVAQTQPRQIDDRSKNEIPGIISPYVGRSLLQVVNRRPDLACIACRLQLSTETLIQGPKLAFHLLDRSGLRVKQIVSRAREAQAGTRALSDQYFCARRDISNR